ncbi:hypothetical protein [Streptomyces sp. NPDC093094]|uniref:hypothetical protein n=1 Tax=Streptomyces sp. NPDC093094 TaxID=3366026 RepID=UPI00380EF38E
MTKPPRQLHGSIPAGAGAAGPVWRWRYGSHLADGDRVAEIRLGRQHLTLTLRTNHRRRG